MEAPGYWHLDHKLHPRTGFMIIFPGSCLIGVFLLLAFSHAPGKWSGMEGIAAAALLDAIAVSFVSWLNLGHVVAWDDQTVFVRQPDADFLLRRYPFASVPFSDIRGLIFHPSPRGVPPKYPLLELDAPSHVADLPLFIDPNYFTASSLTSFINDLRQRLPQLREGKQGKAIDGLLRVLARRT